MEDEFQTSNGEPADSLEIGATSGCPSAVGWDLQSRADAATGFTHLKADLVLAVARYDFRLLYQPLIDLASGRIVGIEALLRWHNRRLDIEMSPRALFDIARDLRVSSVIDLWVARAAITELYVLRQSGLDDLRLSINMTAETLSSPAVVTTLTDILTVNGIDPGLIDIDVRESDAISARADIEATLYALKAAGFRIAIDDVCGGTTGPGSFETLPIDRMKIDGRIVRRLATDSQTRPLIASLQQVCAERGIAVTAKGIETEEQRSALASIGGIEGQGFYLARPQTVAALIDRLQHERALPSAADRMRRQHLV